MTPRSKDFARLGASLRRVRVAEKATPDGGKKVWHQGEAGAEVISFVDPGGRVTRQEAYLDDRVGVWRPGAPLSSGKIARADSATDAEAVHPDPVLDLRTLQDLAAMLEGYQGDDRYLGHLRTALRAGLDHLEAEPLDEEVTGYVRRVTDGQAPPAPAVPSPTPVGGKVAALAAALLLGAGLAGWLFLRR